MFCSKCGKADQTKNTYCRQCGAFLAEYNNYSPEKIIRANLTFSLMSAVVSLALAISVYVALSLDGNTSSGIYYFVAAFLIALSTWQFTTFALNLKLRKSFTRRNDSSNTESEAKNQFASIEMKELLNETDLSSIIPPGVIENTTKNLPEKIRRKSS